MSVLHLVRRTHLYLGLFLLPWVIMYGVSSIPFNHNRTVETTFTRLADVPFSSGVADSPEGLRVLGRQMMDAAGVSGGFYVSRPNPRQVNVNHPNFLGPIRIFYYIDRQSLVAERRDFQLRLFLTALHTRGGYGLGGSWDTVWAVLVDLLSISLLLWIASGLWMWWKLPGTGLRRWGWLALAGGAVSFAVMIARL
jgi:hypothetical protein